MSGENVEIVRRAWETRVNRGVEPVLEYFAEDCVVEDFPNLPDPGVYEGKEGVREINRHFLEMWGDFTQEPVEFIDAGDEQVVAVVAMRGRGMDSGAPLDARAFWVHELYEGKLARMRAFTTREQALQAAGLSE